MRWRVLAAVAAVLALSGCFGLGSGPGTGTGQRPASSVVSCEVGSQPQGASCVPCPDYEGCFTDPAQMEYFFNVIVPWIRDYSKTTYKSMSEPSRWFYIKPGESGNERCTTHKRTQAVYTENSYEYCPADNVVYVGQTAMWNYYLALGDAAPAVGLAHEWGHHVQSVAGVDANTPAELIRQEDQADCIAGAWSAYLVQRKIMVDDDFGDVGQLLVAIGETEGPERTHGTAAERTESWKQGFTGAIRACSSFFPDHPLIT